MSTDAASYRQAYEGWLSGLMQWDDLDAVLARVAASPEGWWVYDTRADPPEAPQSGASLPERLAEIVAFLRRHHRADYCGFVYADDRAAPRMIKVYDPRNASSCSLGAPIPVYTLSRARPERLPFESAQEPVVSAGLLGRWIKGAP